MRLPTKQVKELQAKTIELHDKGHTTPQICDALKVTDKTVRKWLKPYKLEQTETQKMKTLLIQRINALLSDPASATNDIKSLYYCLNELKRKQAQNT